LISADVTFVETEPYFTHPSLQRETSSVEDKDELVLPNFLQPTPAPKPLLEQPTFEPSLDLLPEPTFDSTSQARKPKSSIQPALQTAREETTTDERFLHIYSRRNNPKPKPRLHLSSVLTLGNEVISIDSSSNVDSMTDINLPIALRKGIRECTKHPLYPISHFVSFKRSFPPHRSFLTNIHRTSIPTTLSKALNSKNWRNAMNVEIQALERNNTWEIVDLPKGKKPIGCKWVFTIKYKADRTLERYKTRSVAKVYIQSYGIDYQETFALVAKMNMVRILLSVVVNFDCLLLQFDVNNDFLHGNLEEEIYMDIPLGFNKNRFGTKVYRLKKALYGLKQLPRAWF